MSGADGLAWSSRVGLGGGSQRGIYRADIFEAFVRKSLPVLAVTASERDHLVIGGTELVSAEAHILFW